ncbi:MAG: glutaminase A [Oligoflexia bacterium]|nr:glutaminase A [Oligoflexia bacterium]
MNLEKNLQKLYTKLKNDLSGDISTSIPALALQDPDLFAISAATVDGQIINIGDTSEELTIQSISKAFTYGLALEQNGNDFIEAKVGMEPTGEDFDSVIKLDDQNRPFNPMVNSGAIVVTGMINALKEKSREEEIIKYLSAFAGRELTIDNQTYESEKKNGHKNWAIAHLLRHFKILSKDFSEDLDLYFRQCSLKLNCTDLALMGATLANKGINPKTKEKCIERNNLRNVLSVLFTCGMYNYSGEWVFDIGLPAKSGISGGVLMVIPGLMSIAVYSPRLDKRGNSVRGIKVCEEISEIYKLHMLDYAGPSNVSEIL